MIKLLRKFSFNSHKSDKSPYMLSRIGEIQDSLNNYFDTTPPGKVIDWCYGKLLRNEHDATYTDSKGNIFNFNKTSSPMWLYKNPDIKKQWDKVWTGYPKYFIESITLGNSITHDLESITTTTKNTPFFDISQCEYKDLATNIFQTLGLIANEVALQFPDRKANKLTALDFGSKTGDCPNHGTHNGFPVYTDIQYYTKGESNYTQKGYPKTYIWNTNGTLDTNIFDVERNALFVLMLNEAFPYLSDTQILVWPDIKKAILTAYKSGSDEYKILNKILREENTPSYNHNLHMHINFKKQDPNYEMIL